MYFHVAGQILLVLFSVIGIYSSFKYLVRGIFKEKNYIFAIEILTQRDAESAEVLIRSALCQYFAFSGGRYAILTTDELADDRDLRRLVQKYGLELFVV